MPKKTEKAACAKTVLVKKNMDEKECPAPDALEAAYYALSRYPLYKGVEQGKPIRVLFVMRHRDASGALPLLKTVIWMGQMDVHPLKIDIVTDDTSALQSNLKESMPLLSDYASFTCDNQESEFTGSHCYVSIALYSRKEEIDAACRSRPAGVKQAARSLCSEFFSASEEADGSLNGKYAPAWTAVMLGKNTNSFARNFVSCDPRCTALILDAYSLAGFSQEIIQRYGLHALNKPSARMEKFFRKLHEQAIVIETFYGDANIGHADNNLDFSQQEWKLKGNSSAAAALHIPVKFQCVGLNPAASNKSKLAGDYGRLIFDKAGLPTGVYRRLLLLEHQRWLMYLTTEGWDIASIAECRQHCFVRGKIENWAFKIRSLKKHPALVAADNVNSLLTEQDFDAFTTYDAINESDKDPLDKVSLKLHLLAGEKLPEMKQDAEKQMERLEGIAYNCSIARNAVHVFAQWLWRSGFQKHGKSVERDAFGRLEEAINRSILSQKLKDEAQSIIEEIKKDVKLADEYHSKFDNKRADAAIVEHAGEIYCRPEKLVIIKLMSAGMLQNVTSALIMEPDELVLFGMQSRDTGIRIKKILDKYTLHRTSLPLSVSNTEKTSLLRYVKKALKDPQATVLIDTTGAEERLISMAWEVQLLVPKEKRLGMICSNSHLQSIENLYNAPMAQAYRRHICMRVEDLMELQANAREAGEKGQNRKLYDQLISLRTMLPDLWEFSSDSEQYRRFVNCMSVGNGSNENCLSAGCWLYSLKNKSAVTDRFRRIEGEIKHLFDDLLADKQITNYNAESISGPLELVDQLRYLLGCTSAARDKELVYTVTEDGVCTISYQNNCQVLARCKKEKGLGRKTKDIPLQPQDNGAQLLDICQKLPLTNISYVAGNYLRASGPQALLDEVCQLPGKIRKLQRSQNGSTPLILDVQETDEEYRIVAGSSLATLSGTDDPLIVWRRWRSFTETDKKVWCHVDKERCEAAGLETLLRAMQEKYNVRPDLASLEFSFVIDRTVNPDKGTLSVYGPARLVQAVEAIVDEIGRRDVGRLSFDKDNESIEEDGARVFHTYISCNKECSQQQADTFRKAQALGLIADLKFSRVLNGIGPAEGRVSLTLTNKDILHLTKNIGNLLEVCAWNECFEHTDFSNVINGYTVNWSSAEDAEDTQNELDVLATRGMDFMIISAKDQSVDRNMTRYYMYEIRILANQFSKDTHAVLLHRSEENITNALRDRARNIGVELLQLKNDPKHPREPLLADGKPLAKRLMEIMDGKGSAIRR